jgi:hypothetical protein
MPIRAGTTGPASGLRLDETTFLGVIPAKRGSAVREPGSSRRRIRRVLSNLEVYWIPASAGDDIGV